MVQESEAVLWTGAPKQGIVLSASDALMIPFSLAWCGIAVFWTVSANGHGAPIFFTLWGLMFVAIGLYAVVGRFIHDSMIRARIVYSVSRAGITIVNGATATTIPCGQWTCLEMTTYADGTGTIRFAPQPSPFGYGSSGVWVPSLSRSPQFYRIDDPARVLGIIRDLVPAR